jgi:hypothetical protein
VPEPEPEPKPGAASQGGITSGAWNRAHSEQFETVAGDICVALGNYATGECAVTGHMVLALPELTSDLEIDTKFLFFMAYQMGWMTPMQGIYSQIVIIPVLLFG